MPDDPTLHGPLGELQAINMLEMANKLPDVAFLSIIAQVIQRLEPIRGVTEASDRLLLIASKLELLPVPEEFQP